MDGRAMIVSLLCVLPLIFAQNIVPNVTIQALRPTGVRLSMASNGEITTFIFRANVNKPIGAQEPGAVFVRVINPNSNHIVAEDKSVKLNIGDVLNYYVYVIVLEKTIKYYEDNRSYTVTELIYTPGSEPHEPSTQLPRRPTPRPPSPRPSTTQSQCAPTATTILGHGTSLCSGDIIFEDNFETLREDVWKIEQYIPTKPDYPFVSFQRPPNAPTVSVNGGMLRIEPTLQQSLPGFDADSITQNDNVLDLTSGCTQPLCSYTNAGAQIMPPIASGRLTSSMFSFKYGVIEVRAKLPQGDWLYPDIILEPQANKYGFEKYESGLLRIAGALGNMILSKGSEEYGNKVLYGGPIMDFKCRTHLLTKKTSESAWGDDFHVYSLRWAPDKITLYVDGEEYGRVEPTATGLHTRLLRNICDPPRKFLKTPLAPFDEYFRITLGVSAGGISEFPDQLTGLNLEPKPWKNNAHQAKLKFYEDLSSWHPWPQPALLIDYIKGCLEEIAISEKAAC